MVIAVVLKQFLKTIPFLDWMCFFVLTVLLGNYLFVPLNCLGKYHAQLYFLPKFLMNLAFSNIAFLAALVC